MDTETHQALRRRMEHAITVGILLGDSVMRITNRVLAIAEDYAASANVVDVRKQVTKPEDKQ